MRPARALREESERNAQFLQLPFSGSPSRPKLLVSDVFSHIAASPWSESDAISAGSRPLGQHLLWAVGGEINGIQDQHRHPCRCLSTTNRNRWQQPPPTEGKRPRWDTRP